MVGEDKIIDICTLDIKAGHEGEYERQANISFPFVVKESDLDGEWTYEKIIEYGNKIESEKIRELGKILEYKKHGGIMSRTSGVGSVRQGTNLQLEVSIPIKIRDLFHAIENIEFVSSLEERQEVIRKAKELYERVKKTLDYDWKDYE